MDTSTQAIELISVKDRTRTKPKRQYRTIDEKQRRAASRSPRRDPNPILKSRDVWAITFSAMLPVVWAG